MKPKRRLLFPVLAALLFTACPPPVEDEVPKTTDTTDEDTPPEDDTPLLLTGTIWEWAITGIKLNFTTDAKVSVSSKLYDYTYDSNTRTGTADTLGAFTVDEDFLKLRFTDFWSMGEAVFENKAAGIIGTKWAWEQMYITFTAGKARVNGESYPYTYNAADKTGAIEKIGSFAQDGEELKITKWRHSVFDITLAKAEAVPQWTGALTGTAWGWQNAFNGWMVFEFLTEDKCILTFTNSDYHDDTPEEYSYAYNAAAKTGSIPKPDDTSTYRQGDFSIPPSNSCISFVQWREYPHGAVFNRIQETQK